MSTARAPTPGAPLDIERILALLPHRWPLVMVDRVTEIVAGERIRGHKCIAYNEPWFPGHFPGNPLVPGVLLLECFAQIGGILALTSGVQAEPSTGTAGVDAAREARVAVGARGPGAVAEASRMYVLAIDRAKFRRPVRPGDRLDLDVRTLQRRGTAWKLRGEGFVDGVLAVEAELLADAAPPPTPASTG